MLFPFFEQKFYLPAETVEITHVLHRENRSIQVRVQVCVLLGIASCRPVDCHKTSSVDETSVVPLDVEVDSFPRKPAPAKRFANQIAQPA